MVFPEDFLRYQVWTWGQFYQIGGFPFADVELLGGGSSVGHWDTEEVHFPNRAMDW